MSNVEIPILFKRALSARPDCPMMYLSHGQHPLVIRAYLPAPTINTWASSFVDSSPPVRLRGADLSLPAVERIL